MTRLEDEYITSAPDAGRVEDQPKWRQDFPIDWPQDHYVARRDFTKFMVLTSFAFTAGQFWIVVQNFLRQRQGELPLRKIANVDDIPIWGAVNFEYPGAHDTCLLIRTGDRSFVAFSQKCTHLSCAVVPQPDKRQLLCPCHEGSFDLTTGVPLAGPPRRPLPKINVEIRNGAVYATGLELRTT